MASHRKSSLIKTTMITQLCTALPGCAMHDIMDVISGGRECKEIYMLNLLYIVISYGALLLLLMPATSKGILFCATMFAIGTALISFKKYHKVAFWKRKQYFPISVIVFIVAYLGVSFYDRWLCVYQLEIIAHRFHMTMETMLQIASIVLAAFAFYFIYGILQTVTKTLGDINLKSRWIINVFFIVALSILTVVLSHVMLDVEVMSMGYVNFFWGVLIIVVVILFLLCLTGRVVPSVVVGAGLFMIISTINAYVYYFRSRLFEPIDIFSAGTVMNVTENYSFFPAPYNILSAWGIFLVVLVLFCCLQSKNEPGLAIKQRIALLVACVVSCVAISSYTANLKTYHWYTEGMKFNGYILDFVSKIREIDASKPDNYSVKMIADLAEQYGSDKGTQAKGDYPHIIVIMDEAFSDLGVIGEFSTNTEVTPFISSLKENTISGYTLTSVYAGNTANSEYEFLTGNSMAWLSPNAVPYQQYIRSSAYSMVSYLKSGYDYRCVAMHPHASSGWNRPAAYAKFGFDKCYFVEDFPQEDYVRKYISDQEMFEFLIETFEAQKEDRLFIFGVTMQNHGGYAYAGPNYTQSISLTDYEEFPDVEQYLSLIHETDKAVEYLISYFENIDEDVVIVFFGDHQPGITDVFYETISGTSVDVLNKQQKKYEVPFFIWTNYDIKEEYIDRTSLNYLSSYVYDVAGIDLPPYNQFLSEMQTYIPAITANGFYSRNSMGYKTVDMASDEEQAWLEIYESLQYNSLFDRKNRNDIFFPVLE